MTDPANAPFTSGPQRDAVATADQLAAAREALGMGKGEAAQRLKLHPRQLDAIERGDWASLPGRAFVRGAVRSYGRLLGVDVEPLLQSIGGFAEAEELRPTANLATPMPRSGGFGFDPEGHRSKLPWALLGVAGVIAVGLFFGRDGDVSKVSSWISRTEAPSPAPAAPVAQPASAGTSAAGAPAAGAATVGVPPGTPLVPPPLVPPPLLPATGAASDASTAAAPPAGAPSAPTAVTAPVAAPAAPPPPPPPIRLTVRQDAWVDIRQADGRAVFTGMVKPSAPLELKGTPPFSLTIGNANQVTLEFEGKPIELKPTNASSNIAKVKLP